MPPELDFPERAFTWTDPEFRVVLERASYDDIVAHGQAHPDLEVCGVLVGNVFRDAAGPYVLVSAVIRGKDAREEAEKVTFTHSTWEQIHRDKDELYPELRIVGWYHMHPGFGVFLSEVDLFAHKHFFNAPWQVALVVDPRVPTEGFFAWNGGEVVRLRRYWIGDALRWVPNDRPPVSTLVAGPRAPSRELSPPDLEKRDPGLEDRLFGSAYSAYGILLVALVATLLVWWRTESVSGAVSALARRWADAEETAASRRAQETALWARRRIDEGTDPLRLVGIYVEILRADPGGTRFYTKLLPELAAIARMEDSEKKSEGEDDMESKSEDESK